MNGYDWKNILSRAAWTVLEAFASVMIAAGAFDLNALEAAAIGAGAAALSFLKTLAQEQLAKRQA